ncbi:MAG: hypothetical protein E7289_00740 [Lachnospiraceae bacterium]|nr:hypothetical protein [Lachnospiraceae bacterium]
MDSKELFGEVTEQKEEVVYEQPETEANSAPFSDLTSNQIQEQIQQQSKKGNSNVAVVIVTLLFVLVIGLCIFIAVSLSKMIPDDKEKMDTEYEAQTSDPWEEILGDEYKEENSGDTDSEAYRYPNYDEEDFSGPYYQDTVDCIDETVSYEIKREFLDCVEEENGVNIHTSYIQLEGDIPGVEAINSQIKEETTYFVDNFEKNKENILDTLSETGTGVRAEIKSYVTYNTENMISIVVREDIELGYAYREVAIRSYNINLDTGTILDNTSILDLDDSFGEEFRNRSNKQNGVSEGGTEPYSDEEILAMLRDENTLILFYTPLGMEVGYNYRGDYYTGWITITMQDYEEYLSRM